MKSVQFGREDEKFSFGNVDLRPLRNISKEGSQEHLEHSWDRCIKKSLDKKGNELSHKT